MSSYTLPGQIVHLDPTMGFTAQVTPAGFKSYIWHYCIHFSQTLPVDLQQVCGVCVQQGYSGAPSLVEAVHSTGIHLTHHPDAEFALAVYIVPYPAALASVWVYIASLVKRT